MKSRSSGQGFFIVVFLDQRRPRKVHASLAEVAHEGLAVSVANPAATAQGRLGRADVRPECVPRAAEPWLAGWHTARHVRTAQRIATAAQCCRCSRAMCSWHAGGLGLRSP